MVGFKKVPTKTVFLTFFTSIFLILLLYIDSQNEESLPEEIIELTENYKNSTSNNLNYQIHEVKDGENLSIIFEEFKVPLNTAYRIFRLDEKNLLSKIKPGDKMKFTYLGDEITNIEIGKDQINSLNDLDEEQFGPILHVLKFKSSQIDNLITEINSTGYGLTMGIHTRIESRADFFSQNSNIGNVYINRDIVGAVVGSQPFGGRGLSGSGYKAGGPNYLIQFLNEKVVSKNSVAFGGNAELLNIQED